MDKPVLRQTGDMGYVRPEKRIVEDIGLADVAKRRRGIGARQGPVPRLTLHEAGFPRHDPGIQGRLRRQRHHGRAGRKVGEGQRGIGAHGGADQRHPVEPREKPVRRKFLKPRDDPGIAIPGRATGIDAKMAPPVLADHLFAPGGDVVIGIARVGKVVERDNKLAQPAFDE